MVIKASLELHEFKRTLLAFDFFKDIADDRKAKKELTKVPLHFEDEQHYIDVFLPLFWEEVKMQLHRSKCMEMDHVETVQQESIRVDDTFVRLDMARDKEEAIQKLYGHGDLMLFTQSKDPVKEHPVHFLALVDNSISARLSVTARLDTESGASGSRDLEVAKIIKDNGSWQMAKVANLATITREYEGLMALPKLKLRGLLVNRDDSGARGDTSTEMQAAPNGHEGSSTVGRAKNDAQLLTIPKPLETWLQAEYNESQQSAINDCRKITGITLVQGPPGTGKTKTALGILAVLLNSKAKEAKAVSYTRTGLKGAFRPSRSTSSGDSSSSEEDQKAAEESMQAREMERVQMIRAHQPWLRGGFTPWAETIEQEVPMAGSIAWRQPYPKLSPHQIVSMSEIAEDVAPQKVLVCAPSNAAIDEVIRRATQAGVADTDGVPKKPPLIRLGPGVHPSLHEYSLEQIVKRRLAALSDMPDLNKREVEKQRLLQDARLVCTTLSISGSRDVVGFEAGFDTVVVDEASQGVEVSMLVPLKLGCQRLILIGDPKQLPATCFSTVALEHEYSRSLFERLQLSHHKVNMLHVQYRMHPAISSFPSQHFYEGTLRNAHEELEFEKQCPAPWSNVSCFAPVAFFHLKGEHKVSMSSLVNEDEADFVIQFFQTLSSLYPDEAWDRKIAVISPYAEQVRLIRAKFRALFGLSGKKSPCLVDVNTVDGFQGREKDCVIVSVVRANPEESIGFLRDRRRMNVAFTRARTNLWVVGYADVLGRNKDWKMFIDEQRAASRLLRLTRPYNTFLARYLTKWFDRHPEVSRPDVELLKVHGFNAQAEEPVGDLGLNMSQAELDELKRIESERAPLERDIEEVSDGLGSVSDEENEGDYAGLDGGGISKDRISTGEVGEATFADSEHLAKRPRDDIEDEADGTNDMLEDSTT